VLPKKRATQLQNKRALLARSSTCLCEQQGRTQGGGVKILFEFDMFQKLYYLCQWGYLCFHIFLLVYCQHYANTTEWICMQFSRNIV